MRVYRASPAPLVFFYSLLTILTLGGLAVLVLGVTRTPVVTTAWLLLVWLGLLAWLWYIYLRIPYKIYLRDDQSIEFRSFIRLVILSPQDIVTIQKLPLTFLKVKHTRGSLVLITQMTDIHELIAVIQEGNPAVQVSGV